MNAGETAELEFKNVPLGKKIYAEAEIAVDDIPLYSGKSEEIVVKAGMNKLSVKLNKQSGITLDDGILVIPTLDGNQLTVQIDTKKTSTKYINDYSISLSVTDSENNALDSWNAKLLYSGIDVNSVETFYTFDSSTGRIIPAYDETDCHVPLSVSGIYQILVSIEIEEQVYAGIIDIEIGNAWYFNCDVSSSAYSNMLKMLPSITTHSDIILSGDCTADVITSVVKALNCSSTLDFSALSGINEITDTTFARSSASANKILSIKLPAGLTTIGQNAFAYLSSLETIDIPETVNSIGNNAFAGCSELKAIGLPAELESLGTSAFMNCSSLKRVEIPAGIQVIDENTFKLCSALKEVILHEGITKIENDAFFECSSLSEISLPSTLISLTGFGSSELISITIPASVEIIKNDAFNNTSKLKTVVFEEGSCLKEICSDSFSNTNIVSIKIPDTVKIIGSYAFNGCTELKSITFGTGLKAMGSCVLSETQVTGASITGLTGTWAEFESEWNTNYTANEPWDSLCTAIREGTSYPTISSTVITVVDYDFINQEYTKYLYKKSE